MEKRDLISMPLTAILVLSALLGFFAGVDVAAAPAGGESEEPVGEVADRVAFSLNPSGDSHLGWIFDSSGWVCSTHSGIGLHIGDDYYADDWTRSGGTAGENAFAMAPGTVIYAGSSPPGWEAYGNQVVVQCSADANFAYRYAHLQDVNVTLGQDVCFNTLLGHVGGTGGWEPHLHDALYKNIYEIGPEGRGIDKLRDGESPSGYISGSPAEPSIFAAPFYNDADETVDVDGDGYQDAACGGTDCDDTDPDVHPGAAENCGNGIDDDCDGLTDLADPECSTGFVLALDASYSAGTLSLDYTLRTPEPASWANYLVQTSPSVQVFPLWTISLPVIEPAIDVPVSFSLPSMGMIGIYSGLFTAGGTEAVELEWVETSGSAEDCASFVADLTYPDGTVVSPGETIVKVWRLYNCGTSTWSTAGGYQAVRTSGSYGPSSFAIPTVGPGENGDLYADITVPSTPGTHRATYSMQGPGGTFGDPIWVEITVEGGTTDCATYVGDLSHPDGTEVSPGETISKGWQMSNCGTTTWSTAGGYQAVRTDGSYGPSSFSIPTVEPGQTGNLYADITVPTTSGTHRATYSLEGPGGIFGEPFWVEIVVGEPTTDCAAYGTDLSYPDGTAVSPGETINKGWRMSNCGDTTWSAGGGFRAVRTSGSYGPTSFSIPTVAPGASGDLYASITVPTSSGTHRATYQLEGPRGTFGDPFWVEITVSSPTYDCAAFVADLSYPDGTIVSPGQTISKGWRMSNCGDTTWSAGGGFRAVRTGGSYGPSSFSIPTVGPGATGDLYASITVPSTSGTHRATYQMEGPRGTFGDPFWVEITVQSTTTTVTVDDGDSGFVKYGPSEYWHREWIGYGGDMYWTYVNGSTVSNYIRWNPSLPGSGNYRVKVFVPYDHATTQSAKYKVRANGSSYTSTVNQSIYYDQWVTLGTYYFSDSGSEYVELTDATGESGGTYRKIGFDGVRWERQ